MRFQDKERICLSVTVAITGSDNGMASVWRHLVTQTNAVVRIEQGM